MSERNEYPLHVIVNHRSLTRVVIDQHYKEKHPDVSDELIIELVKSISGEEFLVESEVDGFQYFTAEPVFNNDSPYRLVMLLCIFDDYLGVINAFRVDRSNYE